MLTGSEPSPVAVDDLGMGGSLCVLVSDPFRVLFWSSLVIRENEAARVSEGQINYLVTRSKMLLPSLILKIWKRVKIALGTTPFQVAA